MENLLDYLIYALFGHNVTNVHTNTNSGNYALTGKTWTIVFEGHVYITLDKHDLSLIKYLYESRIDRLDLEERARYQKIFDACK